MDAETAQRLDGILPSLYLIELRRLASEAIRTLRPYISQRKLELRLGLSQGYLSRLLTDAGTPSPALVLLLGQLAKDPASRLPEVDRFWEGMPPPQDLRDIQRRTRKKSRSSDRLPTLNEEHSHHERTKQEPESLHREVRDLDDEGRVLSSLAIAAGCTSSVVASALGHGSFAVTAQHYVDPDTLRNAALRRVAQTLASEPTQPKPSSLLQQLRELSPQELAELLRMLSGSTA